MNLVVEKTKAKEARGEWLTLYLQHLRTVKQPLTFEEYKQKRLEWERLLVEDRESVGRKLEQLENVLGL